MSKSAKNLIVFWLVLLCVAFSALVGKFIFSAVSNSNKTEQPVAVVAGDDEVVLIQSAQALHEYVQNYSAAYSNKNIVLSLEGTGVDKFDMSGYTFDRTLGTEANPFTGKFDGQGYEISNLSFDLSGVANDASNKYVGLFGVTNGAEISNVYISGTTRYKVGDCTNAYVGSVVGHAVDTEFSYIQNVAKMNFQDDIFDKNVYLGTFAGQLTGSHANYIVSRCSNITDIALSANLNREYYIGGFVGYANSTRLSFCVSAFTANIVFQNTFRGTVNLGGIAGIVQHNHSRIFDYTFDNNISVDDTNLYANNEVNIGEVVGRIDNSAAPASGNLAYIYYHTTSNNPVFGYMGGYSYVDSVSRDNISKQTAALSSVEDYESKRWDVDNGDWDFYSTWYFTSSTGVINLQCCYGDFTINIGSTLNSQNVVKITEDFNTKYRYGKSAQIKFGFVEIDDGEDVINMQDYYVLSSVTKDGKEANVFVLNEGEYIFQDDNYLKIETLSTGEFVLTIENINLSNWGVFDIAVTAKKFNVSVSSRLYEKNDELREGEIPAYVRQQGGSPAASISPKLTYDESITIRSDLQDSSKPYLFDGWYLIGEDEDTLISNSANLQIVFGHGVYKGDVSIYARYKDDGCMVTFILDEGVKEVYISDRYPTINKQGINDSIAFPKSSSSMNLEIFIKDGYKFDVDEFVKTLNTYKSNDTTEDFCKCVNKEDSDGLYYKFTLNMTLYVEKEGEKFNIDIKTTKEKVAGNAATWYIVGGVGGGVVIIVIIVLIIILKRRNSGFGGGGSMKRSMSKKDYKNMYY